MPPRRIDDTFSISEQIAPRDVAAIAAAGFRSIICNDPDGEAPGQPKFVEIEAAARAAGLEAAYLPITHGGMGAGEIRRFAELMRSLPGPVLAYCRSGARSAVLMQAARAPGASG